MQPFCCFDHRRALTQFSLLLRSPSVSWDLILLFLFYFWHIRFSTKESASQAIVGVHGTEIFGYPVKCSWGKEPNESPGSSPSFASLSLQTVSSMYRLDSLHECINSGTSCILSSWIPDYVNSDRPTRLYHSLVTFPSVVNV